MQFNLVNNQEQVAKFVRSGVAWHGVAWRCVGMALAFGFISSVGGVSAAFAAWGWISPWGAFLGRLPTVLGVSGSLAY